MTRQFTSQQPHLLSTAPITSGMLQRKCRCGGSGKGVGKCEECADDERKQDLYRKSTPGNEIGEVPQIVQDVLRSPGHPLEVESRSYFEAQFGFDFSAVRVHHDHTAAESAKRIDAEAYTVGQHIAFSESYYRPGTIKGDALLGHELTHVVQQSLAFDGTLADPMSAEHEAIGIESAISSGQPFHIPSVHSSGLAKKPKGKATLKKRSAKDNPKLQVTNSKNGSPCACIVFIHNDERNARLTATLMHDHCQYNLAIVDPDSKSRRIMLANGKNVDPNELFPPEIVKNCGADLKSCEDFLVDKADSTDSAEIEKHAQLQFFFAIKRCSKDFSLPVVALHNNAINDTATFRAKKDKAGVDDLKFDIDKTNEEGGTQLSKLRELLKKKIGKGPGDLLLDTKGTTNIFRWCQSNDLSKCHIGDPDHPDNVVWVTNEADFKRLSKEPVNVALQSSVVTGGESETDLSTLFVVLYQFLGKEIETVVKALQETESEDWLTRLWTLLKLSDISYAQQGIRYVNVETPGLALSSQDDSERIRNYRTIVLTLKALGLHCCPDPLADEHKIESGLTIEEDKKKRKGKKS